MVAQLEKDREGGGGKPGSKKDKDQVGENGGTFNTHPISVRRKKYHIPSESAAGRLKRDTPGVKKKTKQKKTFLG